MALKGGVNMRKQMKATEYKGKTKVVQSGSNGATSVAYKILKLNGKEVSRTLLSKDRYSPHNQIIARGN